MVGATSSHVLGSLPCGRGCESRANGRRKSYATLSWNQPSAKFKAERRSVGGVWFFKWNYTYVITCKTRINFARVEEVRGIQVYE